MQGNQTFLSQEYGRDIARAFLPIDIILSIVLLLGIIGNIFVIFIFATKMRTDQRGSRYFIPILAFYDLLVCITSEIYILSITLNWTSFRSDELCKSLIFFLVQTMVTSDAFLLAIAVQRFIKICRPTAKQMTLYWRRVTVFLVIATNTLYSIPSSIVSGAQEYIVVHKNMSFARVNCASGNNQYPRFQLIYCCMMMFILVVNIGVTAGLYTPIALVVYRHFRKRNIQQRAWASGENTGTVESSSNRYTASFSSGKGIDQAKLTIRNPKSNGPLKTNFNIMFLVVISTYMVSYLPTTIMLTYVTIDDTIWATSSYDEIRSYLFLSMSYVFNHAVNPFVYAYFDTAMRSHMTRFFCQH